MTDSVVEKSGYLHNQCQEACFFHYSKTIEIMETEYVELYEGEYLDAALKRKYGDKNIPTNVILDKTLTGIGATYTELHSCRNSIIIEPNVPVIIDKAKKHSDWLTVYSATTVPQIKKYLNDTKIRYKKILTTPEGFKKIRKAADKGYKQIQSDYFCLFDECEKITQDCDYRGAITQPVYDFFEFENKAFVSATPLEVRHPKFEEQGFKKIKIAPQFDYKKNLHLIVTNSYEKTVREELEKLKDSPCVCIFLNSVTGINGLVNSFKIMDESYIFCSEDGVKKLKDDGFTNALSEICYPLRRYNLFTSRFYSAIDINLDVKPDVLILTNLNQADYTKIDPFTEAIQIQGRFRVKFEDGQAHKKSQDTSLDDVTGLEHPAQERPALNEIGRDHIDVPFFISHRLLLTSDLCVLAGPADVSQCSLDRPPYHPGPCRAYAPQRPGQAACTRARRPRFGSWRNPPWAPCTDPHGTY